MTTIASFNIDTLDVGGHTSHSRSFCTNSELKEITVNVTNLTGDSSLIFGNRFSQNEEGDFKFAAGNTAGFSYWLRFVSAGNLALTSSNFSQASLELSSDLGCVMLSQDVWFDKLIVDGKDKGLRAGTYLLTTLNDFFTGGHLGFSGSGAFHIGAVPESKHFANLMSLLVLFSTYLRRFFSAT